MMRHNYPFPGREVILWIEEARRNGVPEEDVRRELRARGLSDHAIEAALAPACTICWIAENSVLKIGLYGARQMVLYGTLLGFPAAWYMAHANSRALRGQDRMERALHYWLVAYAVIFDLGALGALLLARAIGGANVFRISIAFFLLLNVVFTLLLSRLRRRRQEPFRAEAAKRDELAPASMMPPFFLGVGSAVLAYMITPFLLSSILRLF